jgi:transaldolase
MSDALGDLTAAGVAVWLDDMSRDRIRTGNLADLIRDRHLVGATTNPTIFEKAITGSELYDAQLRDLALRGVDVGEALRAITTMDVRSACDVLRPVFDATDGTDGRVSIEVDPRIAHDTEKTVAEARALWWLVDRPNLFIKIPATVEGLPAISQCLAEGISVNVTLIFSLQRYDAVMEAFLDGLERRRAATGSLEHLESVASFFVSRVDTEVDNRLDILAKESTDPALRDRATALRGQAAIANARLAYEHYERIFESPRWAALVAAGGHPQRPLWASTGVKDPTYDDTMYVVELVAPGTVNTMPQATLDAVFEHGQVRGDTVRGRYVEAQTVLDDLAALGIDYDEVVDQLEREGVKKFDTSWNSLIDSITAQLEAQGADVSADGSSTPAGQGPAAGRAGESGR